MKVSNSATFTDNQFRELTRHLTTHCPSVLPFIKWLKDYFDTYSDCPKAIRALVRAVGASSPVCGLLRPREDIHELFKELVHGNSIFSSPDKVRLLQEECPVVFSALRELTPPILPRSWCPMFEEMLKRSMLPFLASSSLPTDDNIETQALNDNDGLCFFPTLPKRRLRKFYAADAARRKEDICVKRNPGHTFFLPGLFTLFCIHGNHCYHMYVCMCLCERERIELKLRKSNQYREVERDITLTRLVYSNSTN